jgi:hypothetical protein
MSAPTLTFAEELNEANGTLTTDLNGGTLHLYTAVSPPLHKSSIAADFTEAVYTGYAPKVVATWSAAFRDLNGDATLSMPSQNFVGPAAGGGPTVLGCYYLSSGNSTILSWAAAFDTPVSLLDALTLLQVTAQIGPSGGGWVSTEGSVLP